MPKVLLVSSITHNGTEYLPGIHDISEELHEQWSDEAPHIFSPIPVESVGKTVRAPDAPEKQKEKMKQKAE